MNEETSNTTSVSTTVSTSIVTRFKDLDVKNHMTIHKPFLNPNNNVFNTQILYNNHNLVRAINQTVLLERLMEHEIDFKKIFYE